MDADLSKKVNEIMANPEFQSLVRELRGSEDMPDSAEVSAKLPEVMATFGPMLSKLMGGTARSGDGDDHDGGNGEEKKTAVKEGSAKPFLGDTGNRNRLLSALKPYLSPERGLLIDRALSAMQFGEMLGSSGDKHKNDGGEG